MQAYDLSYMCAQLVFNADHYFHIIKSMNKPNANLHKLE